MKRNPDFRVACTIAFALNAWCLATIVAAEDAPEAKPPAAKEKGVKPGSDAVEKTSPSKEKPKASEGKADAAAAGTTKGGEEKANAEEKKNEGEEAATKPTLHKVERGEFELKVELDGIFESAQETPISISPEAWGDLTVIEVVPHGSPVKKGEVLVRLETEKLAEEIADLRKDAPLADLNLQIARQELEALEKTTPLSLDNARREKMEAEQDLAYYEDVTRGMRERDAEEDVKRIEQQLAYAREELRQLEQMYKADDLTEETEEIILERSRNDVAYYEWIAEQTRARSQRALTTSIPREHGAQRRDADGKEIAWRQAEKGLPAALKRKRLEIAAQERAREKSSRRLADLEKDLVALVVKAPHDGIVYYGASQRGKWVTAATVERKLVPGGKLAAREVFLTLVKPAPLQVHVSVPEAKLRHLEPGQKGFAWPAFDADAEFPTRLESVSFVPYADNTYDAVFSVPKAKPDGPPLFPGMTAKVRLDLYEAADALTAPRKAVHRDAEGHYVHLEDGTKRKIKVGKANEKVYEILAGLKEGDMIKVP